MRIHIRIMDENGNIYEGTTDLEKSNNGKREIPVEIDLINKKKPLYNIKQLFLKNFFKGEKKLGEVTKKLKEDGFNFKPGSIQYALDIAEFLERRGEKGNYRWIQKYPPR
ncbi:MAG: hypothetical protein WD512_00040 [Candidatus Paceibacterota bacterium]